MGETLNMISSISNLTPAQPAVQPASSTATAQPSPADSVQISNTAKALLQEAMENSVQTAQEARGGDVQAMRLLAREAAAKVSVK
jgi:hypothetical protein